MNKEARRISVPLEKNPYEIIIGNGSLKGIGEELTKAGFTSGQKVLVVSNPEVAEAYGKICMQSLEKHGFAAKLLEIKAGEKYKTPQSIQKIHDAAFENKLERGSLMIALGGGVVGDMTGFAAATWLRGIAVVQIPTTLLAMVDAAIGGKTGVNHPCGKNLIGAFHQPKLVLIDPYTLNTLPEREFRAGIAEVIKYGVIGDPQLFERLELLSNFTKLDELEVQELEEIIERSAATKAKVVASDETEKGNRAILNYGHTFGHVVETLCGYGTWIHGEAVAIGMIAVGELAVQVNSWSRSEADRQAKLIKKVGLPFNWPNLNPQEVIETLRTDKKVQNGKIRLIMPKKIGEVEIVEEINYEQLLKCLDSIKG
ncbi:3-dehydroquinate synthase [Prochlorococcus sp. MIT 1300]|uniref:3-dehydroquinate synthase n=1 Tax=Prochlorococcus sp. MIT 1300 TaxID=3096218 RepID=UPI002A74BC2D|nr:3-dehydroquinate synthase [Prochlorococcus sp. MIT 1300]